MRLAWKERCQFVRYAQALSARMSDSPTYKRENNESRRAYRKGPEKVGINNDSQRLDQLGLWPVPARRSTIRVVAPDPFLWGESPERLALGFLAP